MALGASDIEQLRQEYLQGQLPPEVARAFEAKYPAAAKGARREQLAQGLIPREQMTPDERLSVERAEARREAEPLLAVEGGGLKERFGFMVPLVGPLTESLLEESRAALPSKAATGLEMGTTLGLSLVPALGGVSLGTRLLGSRIGPLGAVLGEMGGSLAGRKFATATGLEKEDTLGDILALGAPGVLGGLGAGKRLVRQALLPSLPSAEITALRDFPERARSAFDIIQKGAKRTPYESGTLVQEALARNRGAIKAMLDEKFAAVREAAPSLDVGDILAMAKEEAIPLPLRGISLAEGAEKVGAVARSVPGVQGAESVQLLRRLQTLTFDEAIELRSALLAAKREAQIGIPGSGGPLRARQLGLVESALESRMEEAAKAGGVLRQWRAANRFFREEFADRFANRFIHDIPQVSGEQVGQRLSRVTVDEAQQFLRAMSALNKEVPKALDEARAALVGSLFQQSTLKNGVIRPDLLANQLARIQPEVKTLLLGRQVTDALEHFATTLGRGNTRISIAVGSAGAAATGTAAGGMNPLAALPTTIETINELNFLGRMIVTRPSINKAMVAAILTGRDEALRRMTGLQSIRIVGTQAGLRGLGSLQP